MQVTCDRYGIAGDRYGVTKTHLRCDPGPCYTLILDGSFATTWIPTSDMPADIFTKPLGSILFLRHCDVLGLSIPLSSS